MKKRSEKGILKRVIWMALQIPEAIREEATMSARYDKKQSDTLLGLVSRATYNWHKEFRRGQD